MRVRQPPKCTFYVDAALGLNEPSVRYRLVPAELQGIRASGVSERCRPLLGQRAPCPPVSHVMAAVDEIDVGPLPPSIEVSSPVLLSSPGSRPASRPRRGWPRRSTARGATRRPVPRDHPCGRGPHLRGCCAGRPRRSRPCPPRQRSRGRHPREQQHVQVSAVVHLLKRVDEGPSGDGDSAGTVDEAGVGPQSTRRATCLAEVGPQRRLYGPFRGQYLFHSPERVGV